MARLVLRIFDPIGIHVPGVFILQQRKSKLLCFMKLRQQHALVVRHRSHLNTDLGKSVSPLCQLDQLALAVRSPIGGSAQYQQQSLLAGQVLQVPQHSALIICLQQRKLATDLRAFLTIGF
jgi:hypothetical protein